MHTETDLTDKSQQKQPTKKVSLQELSNLTGFSVELIKSEILSKNSGVDQLSLEELRELMLEYIDQTFLDK